MTLLVPIGSATHALQRWRRPAALSFARQQSLCSIFGAELGDAAASMPIVLARSGSSYEPMALLSPVAGRNLYISPDGQWMGDFIPAALRTYPFRMMRASDTQQLVLCFDEDSGLMAADGEGEPFFQEDGRPTEFIQGLVDYLSTLAPSQERTTLALAALDAEGVIEPWPLQVEVDGQTKTVDGLFRIAEARLNALSDDAIARVHKAGALPIAYLQLISMRNVQRFPKLMQLQDRLAAHKQAVPKLEDMFRMSSDSDVIKFD